MPPLPLTSLTSLTSLTRLIRVALMMVVLMMAVASTPAVVSAQSLSLALDNGLVTLDARNVPVRQILERWSQVAGISVVNLEGAPATPLTMQLAGVTERAALATILRHTTGYILVARRPTGDASSSIDRIVLTGPASASGSAPASASESAPASASGSAPGSAFGSAPGSASGSAPALTVATPGAGLPPLMAPGRGNPGFEDVPGTPPPMLFNPTVTAGGGADVATPGNTRAPAATGAPTRARPAAGEVQPNPFGVSTGSAQPGTIAPAPEPPQQRDGPSGGHIITESQ